MAETKNRNFLADYRNWPEELDFQASFHRKKCYFKVGGYQSTFNAFRAALWANKGGSCSILTGVRWRTGWTSAKYGIIPKESSRSMFAHALKIFGQKKIDGELYLVAQLSNGESIGDKGVFYFPEDVINRDFKFGAFMFRDFDPNEAKQVCWSRGRRIIEKIKNFFKNILK